MIVLSDTTPLNYLVLIDHDEVLPALFGKIYVPRAVRDELGHPHSPRRIRDWIERPPSWLEVRVANVAPTAIKLGRGEGEAICLAEELSADLLLMDDRVARNAARKRSINVAGTVNILEAAARRGLLDLRAAVSKLRATNFHVSDRILAEVLLADEAWRKRQPE